MEAISSFSKENRFLSNFFPLKIPVIFEGLPFFTVETAYVAAKTSDINKRHEISKMKPGEAKRIGKEIFNLAPNPNWSPEFRLQLMEDFVFQKFSRNEDLKQMLLATGECELIEGNHWHDNFFGVCNCGNCPPEKLRPKEEQNHLGEILTKVRERLKRG